MHSRCTFFSLRHELCKGRPEVFEVSEEVFFKVERTLPRGAPFVVTRPKSGTIAIAATAANPTVPMIGTYGLIGAMGEVVVVVVVVVGAQE